MELGPISPIRPVSMIKPSPAAPDLSRVVETEYHGQPGDDQYTPSNAHADRGLEDEDEDELAEEAEGEETRPAVPDPSKRVSFFA